MDEISDDVGADGAWAGDDAWADDEELWAPPEDCTDAELERGVPLFGPRERAEALRAHRRACERWRRLPDDAVPEALPVVPARLDELLRAVRGRARLNQRELAAAAGLARSVVSRIEGGDGRDLRLSTLTRLLDACGLRLAVVDDEGTQLASPPERERFRDGADRHLPAHLSIYKPDCTHRSRYRRPDRPGPARVTAGRDRNAHHFADANREMDPD